MLNEEVCVILAAAGVHLWYNRWRHAGKYFITAVVLCSALAELYYWQAVMTCICRCIWSSFISVHHVIVLCSCGRRQHHHRTTVTYILTRLRALFTSHRWCQRINFQPSMYARVTSDIVSTATVCYTPYFIHFIAFLLHCPQCWILQMCVPIANRSQGWLVIWTHAWLLLVQSGISWLVKKGPNF